MAAIDNAAFARSWNDFAEHCDGLAVFAENIAHPLDRVRLDDADHADAAIESAQQLELCDATLLCQPFEHRQHRQPRKIDADAEMPGQHARDVVGEAAA